MGSVAGLGQWVEEAAESLDRLPELVGDARVVALGVSTRLAHEPAEAAYHSVRVLVEQGGFRTVALEGDDPERLGLGAYVRGAGGDPRTLLAQARPFLRTEEVLALVRWMRAYNGRNPDDPVRFARARDGVAHAGQELADIERQLADDVLWWQDRTGDRIAYWGGLGHTAVGRPRTVSPGALTHTNAGGYLRERLGSGYVSVGLTFDHGHAGYPIPAPPRQFAEAALGGVDTEAFLLDLRSPDVPPAVRAWRDTPAPTRLIGPTYDPADNAAYQLAGGSLAEWFDLLIHHQVVTDAGFLTTAA